MGVSSRSDRRFPSPIVRLAPAASLLVVAGLVAAACGRGPIHSSAGSGATTGQPVTLTLYNAQHEQTTHALIAAFTKATGIKVRVDNDNEDDLTARIELEGNRSPADLVYTENSNWLQQLDDRGLLTEVDSSTLAHVPKADSATNGGWVGVSARISVLVYNPSKVERVAAAHFGARAGRSEMDGQDRDRPR